MTITTINGVTYTVPQDGDVDWGVYTSATIKALGDNALYPIDVVDALDSSVTDVPLSAAQGKALKDAADTLDGVAVKTDTADQFSALDEKVTLADDDLILIEDSVDSGAKKKVKKSSLGGGGSSTGYLVLNIAGNMYVNIASDIVFVDLPYDCTFTVSDARVGTAPTGAALQIDVLINGTTVWHAAEYLEIADSATTGTKSDFDTTGGSEGDRISLRIAQIGSTVAGADLCVRIEIEPT